MSHTQAIALTEDERLAILDHWDSPEEFAAWQRDVLRDEILRRAQIKAQEQARQIMSSAEATVKGDFPTLFSEQDKAGGAASVGGLD